MDPEREVSSFYSGILLLPVVYLTGRVRFFGTISHRHYSHARPNAGGYDSNAANSFSNALKRGSVV